MSRSSSAVPVSACGTRKEPWFGAPSRIIRDSGCRSHRSGCSLTYVRATSAPMECATRWTGSPSGNHPSMAAASCDAASLRSLRQSYQKARTFQRSASASRRSP